MQVSRKNLGVVPVSWWRTSYGSNNNRSRRERVLLFLPLILLLLLSVILYDKSANLFGVHTNNNNMENHGAKATNSKNEEEDDLYQTTPFCSPDGICGESPSIPSPRTIYSSWSKAQYEKWMNYYNHLNTIAKNYAEQRRRQKASHHHHQQQQQQKLSRPFILLGDSITENWVETSYGTPSTRGIGISTVLQDLVQELHLDPLVLGISGDQTQHLLWRLQTNNNNNNGDSSSGCCHLHPEYANDPESIFVVLIGTNNLGSGELPGPTADGILAVLQYLLEHTQGTILYLEVLPRGDDSTLKGLCPPRCQNNNNNNNNKSTTTTTTTTTTKQKPYKSFLPAIDRLNNSVRQNIDTLVQEGNLSSSSGGGGSLDYSSRSKQRIFPIQCGLDQFLIPDDSSSSHHGSDNNNKKKKKKMIINTSLMPDRLHPNVEGHRILANCIKDVIINSLDT